MFSCFEISYKAPEKMNGVSIGKLAALLPLAFLSLFGNSLLFAVKVRRCFQNKLNCGDIFIMNLSICDLLKTFCFFLISIPSQFSRIWPIGLTSCIYMSKGLFILFTVTSLTTVVLTVERYHLIAKPYSQRMNVKKGLILLSLTWILTAGILNIPGIFSFRLYMHDVKLYCLRNAVKNDISLYMEVILLSCTVFLSTVVIPTLSLRATRILSENSRRVLSDQPAESQQHQTRVRRHKSAMYVLRSITIAHTTTYLPWSISYFYEGLEPEKYIELAASPQAIVLYWFIAGSFCNTSLTYLAFSKEFRKEMRGIFSRMVKRQQSSTIKVSSQDSKAEAETQN